MALCVRTKLILFVAQCSVILHRRDAVLYFYLNIYCQLLNSHMITLCFCFIFFKFFLLGPTFFLCLILPLTIAVISYSSASCLSLSRL